MTGQPREPLFNGDQCLQALQGQPAAGASARAGTLLRGLLREQLQRQGDDARPQDEALLARLRSAGAFAGAAPAWWRRLLIPAVARRLTLPLGAALSITVGGLLWLQIAPRQDLAPDDGEVLRGAESALQLHSAHPQQMAAELQALLQTHGVASRLLALPSGSVQLQAKLLPTHAAARAALAARGVQVPEHGRLLLLVRPNPGNP